MVSPTISGMTVDQRAQVLMIAFSPERLRVSTFFINLASTAGPFFVERDIPTYSLDA
jgi:hypothetical protein